jgi:HEPN domain-containing protein
MTEFNSPEEIERLLIFNRSAKEQFPTVSNLPTLERKSKSKFEQEAVQTTFSSYVTSADYHYAVARLLFELGIHAYALFCSQQAIENYLKAYIKLVALEPKLTHSLNELLAQCQLEATAPPFITSDFLKIIVQRFDPFNELARYPVQRTRPEGMSWGGIFPDDMNILDYFFFKMREIVPIPINHSSLFKDGHYQLGRFENKYPEIYEFIKKDNINFK